MLIDLFINNGYPTHARKCFKYRLSRETFISITYAKLNNCNCMKKLEIRILLCGSRLFHFAFPLVEDISEPACGASLAAVSGASGNRARKVSKEERGRGG